MTGPLPKTSKVRLVPVFVFENQDYGTFPLRKRTTSGWRASTRTERCCSSTYDRSRGTVAGFGGKVAPVMDTVGKSVVSLEHNSRGGHGPSFTFRCSDISAERYGALIYET